MSKYELHSLPRQNWRMVKIVVCFGMPYDLRKAAGEKLKCRTVSDPASTYIVTYLMHEYGIFSSSNSCLQSLCKR